MRKVMFVLVPLLAIGFWGCGSNKDSDAVDDRTPGTSITDAQFVGSDSCKGCHTTVHSAYFSQLGKTAPTAAAITVECEYCHGGGQYHVESGSEPGPIPYPEPQAAKKILASKHNGEEADNINMIAVGHDTGKCQRCHTAEGAVAFASVIGDKTEYDKILNYGSIAGAGQYVALPNLLDMSKSDDSVYKAVRDNHTLHNPTCATCHDPFTKELSAVPGWDPNGNATADQFDLCTNCHLYQLADGTIVNSGLPLTGGAGTAAFYHDTSWYRNVTSTHFDNPATGPQTDGTDADTDPDTNTKIEGYVIRKNSQNPCFDCHGHEMVTRTGNLVRNGEGYMQTEVEATIHTDWAKSAHAGNLLKAKYAAQENGQRKLDGTLDRNAVLTQVVSNAYTDDSTDPGLAWTHYDWDNNATRAGCQRCHTATGASNYLSAPAAYKQANNDFSHLNGWFTNGRSDQQEVLYCWGCHVSVETGEPRNPGAVTVKSLDNPPVIRQIDGVNVVLPDAGKSNGCISCHSGTGNMFSAWSETRIPSHHGVSAAVLFGTTTRIGFEFVDLSAKFLDYRIPTAITSVVKTHAQIGMESGGAGPCVSCHMPAAKHLFTAVDEDAHTITAQTLCNTCHTVASAYEMTFAKIEEEKAGYVNAGALLAEYIGNTIANYKGAVITGTMQIPDVPNDRAAWYNFKLFPNEEKGAFAHNRFYTKRLIFDSIDWLQNGALNGAIDTTIINAITYAAALAWLDGNPAVAGIQRP